MGGEESDLELSSLLPTLIPLPNNANGTSGGGSSGSGGHRSHSSGSPPASPGGSSRGAPLPSASRAPPRAMPFAGSSHGASGGYSGTEGRGDWAMEREMEIMRLEAENKALRELLAIAEEAPEIVQQIEEDEKSPVPPPPQPMGRRKSSLTVEELEASAEKEAEERKIAEDAGETYQTPEERRAEEEHAEQLHMEERRAGLLELGPSQETRMGPDGARLGSDGVSLGFKYGEEPILEGHGESPEEAIDDSA